MLFVQTWDCCRRFDGICLSLKKILNKTIQCLPRYAPNKAGCVSVRKQNAYYDLREPSAF